MKRCLISKFSISEGINSLVALTYNVFLW
jgi:hypothetical protein